ncbi:MAG: hypothetical protein RLZZ248_1416 [Bacteroidota bacterium]|jgi:AraC-like DNA-binding protein
MLLIIGLSSTILALALFFKNENRNSNFLAAFFFVLGQFNFTHYYSVIDFDPYWAAVFYNHFAPLYLCAGPFLYFYMRGTINDDFIFKKLDWLHFIPALILLLAIGNYYFIPLKEKMEVLSEINANIKNFNSVKFNVLFTHKQGFIIRALHFGAYVLFAFGFLGKYVLRARINIKDAIRHNTLIKWLFSLLFFLIVVMIAYGYFTFKFVLDPSFLKSDLAKIILSVSGFGLIVLNGILFFLPTVLYGNITGNLFNPFLLNRTDSEDEVGVIKPNSFKDDRETHLYFLDLKQKMDDLVEREQLYKHQLFSIEMIGQMLNVPTHHIRICLKDYHKMGLVEYRNTKKIERAIFLMSEESNNHLTLEAIGEASGFNSKSTFYAVFKKINGKTPLEYLNSSDSNP